MEALQPTARDRLVVQAVSACPPNEIPDRLREAIHLIQPTDCFPYATNTSRHLDIDHTTPWTPATDAVDDTGPPGGTRIGNLGKLTRRHHRIKTHSRWTVRQPFPGIWIWRSPQGRYYLVDHTGTQPLRRAA